MADALREMYPLDEATSQVLAHGGKGQYKVVKDGGVTTVKFKGKVISSGDFDRGADGWFMNIKGEKGQKFFDTAQEMADYFAKNKITEEVDLDEAEAGIKVHAGPDHDRKVKRIQSLAKQLGAKVTNVGKSTDGKMSTIHVKGSMKVVNDLMKLRTEEVDLDEGKLKDLVIKGQDLEAYAKKYGGIDKKDMMKVAAMLKKGDKSGALKYVKALDTDPRDYILDLMDEEVDLDEASPNKQKSDVIVMKRDNSEKSVVGASGVKRAEKDGWKIQYALLAPYGKKVTDPKGIMKAIKGGDKLGIGEEVDLDENLNQMKKHIDDLEFERKRMTTSGQESLDKLIKAKSIKDARKAFDDMYGYEYDRVTSSGQESMVKIGKMLGMKIVEEVDLDEGKMSQLHQYIKDKKSPEEIAKLMKLDVKTIKALMSSHHPEDVDESAASDARRAISKDKDLRRGKDSADDDDFASADDVKGASKNIIMQLRKAGNRASMGVEFGDGKKVQIPAKMAIAVQQKYNAMKKPADKEKFQARIAKSYKDMLSALKEELQPKKESILERMNRKIKENKHG